MSISDAASHAIRLATKLRDSRLELAQMAELTAQVSERLGSAQAPSTARGGLIAGPGDGGEFSTLSDSTSGGGARVSGGGGSGGGGTIDIQGIVRVAEGTGGRVYWSAEQLDRACVREADVRPMVLDAFGRPIKSPGQPMPGWRCPDGSTWALRSEIQGASVRLSGSTSGTGTGGLQGRAKESPFTSVGDPSVGGRTFTFRPDEQRSGTGGRGGGGLQSVGADFASENTQRELLAETRRLREAMERRNSGTGLRAEGLV